MDKIVKALSNPTITLGMPSRPNNVNLRLLGGKLEVLTRTKPHQMGSYGVASGGDGKPPRKPDGKPIGPLGHYSEERPKEKKKKDESPYATLGPGHQIYERGRANPIPNRNPLLDEDGYVRDDAFAHLAQEPIYEEIPPLPYEEVAPRRNARRRLRERIRRNCSIQ